MSTRGVIARATGEATFEGVYHHWDSYPNGGLGQALTANFINVFNRDLPAMLKFLIDEHPAGWSTIVHKDLTLKPGYTDVSSHKQYPKHIDDEPDGAWGERYKEFMALPEIRRAHCFCHGQRHEKPQKIDHTTDCGGEWAYVFEEDNNVMHICRMMRRDEIGNERTVTGMFGCGVEGQYWVDVARIDLATDDLANIDWGKIECGEQYERCTHYAWYHFDELKGSTMGELNTRTFLGYDKLEEWRNVKEVLYKGHRYKLTGGMHSDLLRNPTFAGRYKGPAPKVPTWIGTLRDGDTSLEAPVARITKDGYKPIPGVTWIFPPTKNNPHETLKRASRKSA